MATRRWKRSCWKTSSGEFWKLPVVLGEARQLVLGAPELLLSFRHPLLGEAALRGGLRWAGLEIERVHQVQDPCRDLR